MAVGVMLALAGQAGAEPLVSRPRQEGPPGRGADFTVAPSSPAPAARQAPRRGPRAGQLQQLRERFLREHGVEVMTLYLGYFGGFLPPTSIPTSDAPATAVPGTPPPVTSPPISMPPPAPTPTPVQGMPTSLPAFAPPPQSPSPSPTPEPATLLTGLLGAGLAGLAAWRKRRRKSTEAA
jgi:MYXO-CTERM domain-containing protein